jgi:hypothetical protein
MSFLLLGSAPPAQIRPSFSYVTRQEIPQGIRRQLSADALIESLHGLRVGLKLMPRSSRFEAMRARSTAFPGPAAHAAARTPL